MALKFIRFILTASLTLILFSTFIPTGKAFAQTGHTAGMPLLDVFANQLKNGRADELRGIYVPEILAAPIIQQPAEMDEYVSPWSNIVTQFSPASKLGSTALLAHNYLAGGSFVLMEKGQEFYLIYGDGRISPFFITDVLHYQALQPASTSSEFVSLENGDLLTASELFSKIYNRPGQVILQTCIARDENLAWGRLFVLAEPFPFKP